MKTFSEFNEEAEQVDESLAAIVLAAQLAMATIPAASDATLSKAIDMLPDTQDVEVVLSVQKPMALMQRSVAWTDQQGVVYVNNQSDAYKDAKHGKPAALAAAIAHEVVHVHGGGEYEAYTKQLQLLHQLGASKSEIQDVQRGMDRVVGK
jgi:hypothetical protein